LSEPEVTYSPVLGHLDFWARERGDTESVLELSEDAVALALASEMRPNPLTTYCRQRSCGHAAHRHEGDACVVPGCECEGLRL
jgi:hypothetical protein